MTEYRASTPIRHLCACAWTLLLTAFGGLAAETVQAASMTVNPAQAAPGTSVRITAEGLAASTSYSLEFAGSGITPLATVTSDARGRLAVGQTLPALPVGTGKLRLRFGSLGPVTVAYTSLKVLGSLGFTPGRATVYAGQSLPFSVAGLEAGSLRIDYDGQTVVGPVAVAAGSYSGRFVVPRDHPSGLPRNVALHLENRIGGRPVNALDLGLPVRPAAAAPFALRVTTPPPNEARPGARFTAAGQVDLAENEAPPDDVSLWFFGDDGHTYPLGSADLQVSGNTVGFSTTAGAGGLATMTAGPLGAGSTQFIGRGSNSFGAAADTHANPNNPRLTPLGDGRWRLTVRVARSDGSGIPGALVYFDTPTLEESEPGASAADATAAGLGRSLHAVTATLTTATQNLSVIQRDSAGCPLSLERVLTNAGGYAAFEFTDEALLVGQVQGFFDDHGDFHNTVRFRLGIDASAQGYGYTTPDGTDFKPHLYDLSFDLASESTTIVDSYQSSIVTTGGRDTLLSLALPPIATRIAILGITMTPWAQGHYMKNVNGSFVDAIAFGPVFNRGAVNPAWIHEGGVPGDPGYPTSVQVQMDGAVSAGVQGGTLYLDLDRNGTPEPVGSFARGTDGANCSGVEGLDQPAYWRATLPSLRSQAPGAINGYVQFSGAGGVGGRAYFKVVIAALPDWYAGGDFSSQSVNFGQGWQFASIQAIENTPDNSVELADDPGYQIGTLRNSTQNSRPIDLFVQTNGYSDVSAPLVGAHREAGHLGDGTMLSASPGEGFSRHYTMLDQSFPLFYYVWGAPVLLGVELGADFNVKATMDIEGSYILKPATRQPVLSVTTTPTLGLGLEFYIDLDVLFDLVDGEVALDADFTLAMPVKVTAGQNQTPDPCFGTKLTFSWDFEFFCLPFDVICDAINDIEDSETLLNRRTGNGCSARPEPVAASAAQPRLRPQTALAFDGHGNGWFAFTADTSGGQQPRSLVLRPANGGMFERSGEDVVLSDAPGIRNVELAYYDQNRAVAVWVESADSYAVLKNRSPRERVTRQHLMYATWDGSAWSAKASLTPASTGEGGLTLASCMAGEGGCPAEGELLAAWTRASSNDFVAQRSQVFRARFLPGRGWTTSQSVDPTALLDSAPSATYLAGVPVVAFVRNAGGVFGATAERQFAYRILSGANTVQLPTTLPRGIAWPSIRGLQNGELALAYTRASPGRAFVGNTQRLELARGSGCGAGACNFARREVVDAAGRPIYAERPRLLLDAADHLTVVYRGMGYGAGTAGGDRDPSDPPGVALHTGEVMRIGADWNGSVVVPVALSADGAEHLAPVAAYDSDMEQVVVASSFNAPLAARVAAQLGETKGVRAPAALRIGTDVSLQTMAHGVDFAIDAIRSSATTLAAGQVVQVQVDFSNRGIPYTAVAPHWTLQFHWDGPAATGQPAAAARFLPSLGSGEHATTTVSLTVPAGFAADQTHRLYVNLVRGASVVDDIAGEDDERFVEIGGLPAPQGVQARAMPGGEFVVVNWAASADARVHGYRVWCQDEGGRWKHLGSSFSAGFIDLAAPRGTVRRYAVSSYSVNAVESPRSDAAAAVLPRATTVFADGFE